MALDDDGAAWSAAFAALLERLGPRFGRVEPRRRAAAYLRGLLAPVERKNGWQLAEAAGDRTPNGVQEFLSRVRWDCRLRSSSANLSALSSGSASPCSAACPFRTRWAGGN